MCTDKRRTVYCELDRQHGFAPSRDTACQYRGETEASWPATDRAATGHELSISPGVAVVQVAVRDGEDLGEFGVVCGHHLRLGGLLALCEKALDILNTPEGLLPQLKVTSHLQLLKASLQVQLHGLRVAKIRPVTLVPVPAHIQG